MKQIVPSIIWLVSIVVWLLLVLWTGLVRTAGGIARGLRSASRRQPLSAPPRSRTGDPPADLGREARG